MFSLDWNGEAELTESAPNWDTVRGNGKLRNLRNCQVVREKEKERKGPLKPTTNTIRLDLLAAVSTGVVVLVLSNSSQSLNHLMIGASLLSRCSNPC